MNYYELTIKNDEGNNLFLFCHKVHSFLEINNPLEVFGVFADIETNCVTVRSKNEFTASIFGKAQFKLLKLNIKKNLQVRMGVLPNYNINNEKFKNVKTESDKNGFFPSFKSNNNSLVSFFSDKPVLPLTFESILNDVSKINYHFEIFKIEYKVKNKIRSITLKQVNFILKTIKISEENDIFYPFIKGIGVKKSYGLSKIDFI